MIGNISDNNKKIIAAAIIIISIIVISIVLYYYFNNVKILITNEYNQSLYVVGSTSTTSNAITGELESGDTAYISSSLLKKYDSIQICEDANCSGWANSQVNIPDETITTITISNKGDITFN